MTRLRVDEDGDGDADDDDEVSQICDAYTCE